MSQTTTKLLRKAFTAIELIVAISIILILIGLLLVAVQKVRHAAASVTCKNNLRQIGIATISYHDLTAVFPKGYTRNMNHVTWDERLSWLARITPYIEQNAVWTEITDYNPRVLPVHPTQSHVIRLFGCPLDDRTRHSWNVSAPNELEFSVAYTSYLGNAGTNLMSRDGIFFLNSTTKLTDIVDGSSNTIMAGERPPSSDKNFGWWLMGTGQGGGSLDFVIGAAEINQTTSFTRRYRKCGKGPYFFSPGRFDADCSVFHYWSPHTAGANFVFCDGSVHFLSYSVSPIMTSLATRSGGEVVDEF